MFGSLFGVPKQPESDAMVGKTLSSFRESGACIIGNGSGPYIGMDPDGRNLIRDEALNRWIVALGGLGFKVAAAFSGQPINEALRVTRSADINLIQSQSAVAGISLYKVMTFEFFAASWKDHNQSMILARLLSQALVLTILSPQAYETAWLQVELKFEALHSILPSERPKALTKNTRVLLKELGIEITPSAWTTLNLHFSALYVSVQESLISTINKTGAPQVGTSFSGKFDETYKTNFQKLVLIAKSKL